MTSCFFAGNPYQTKHYHEFYEGLLSLLLILTVLPSPGLFGSFNPFENMYIYRAPHQQTLVGFNPVAKYEVKLDHFPGVNINKCVQTTTQSIFPKSPNHQTT